MFITHQTWPLFALYCLCSSTLPVSPLITLLSIFITSLLNDLDEDQHKVKPFPGLYENELTSSPTLEANTPSVDRDLSFLQSWTHTWKKLRDFSSALDWRRSKHKKLWWTARMNWRPLRAGSRRTQVKRITELLGGKKETALSSLACRVRAKAKGGWDRGTVALEATAV